MWRYCNNYWAHAIKRIYHSNSIEERIETFRQLQISSFTMSETYIQNMENPSYITTNTAKELRQFINQHQIPNNIRIIHALAHIQYNAFMAYADTIFRFKDQMEGYQLEFVGDMRRIALEEGSHFLLLKKRLMEQGYQYGSLPVIPKLHIAIQETQSHLLSRIALISLIHEGRGLKAIRKLQQQLKQLNDFASLQAMTVIESQESKHFDNGAKWFKIVCQRNGLILQEQIPKMNTKFKCKIDINDIL